MNKQDWQTITVHIGSIREVNASLIDNRKDVEFLGVKLGYFKLITDDRGNRGMTQTLYETAEGYVAHVLHWSRWSGEPDTSTLHKVTEEELGDPYGPWRDLGKANNFGRPLTLREALEISQ